ncbi:hypothetical protein HDU76_008304 [Blyttiomyces sp. JEL0837]|nr:hypothetical protein HDU76_008304 [Blyttiomyces sp. JEL0837]
MIGHCKTSSTPSSSSLWDLLPTEIKDHIFNETDIPTRFLNNCPLTESEIEAHAQRIWVAIITTNSWDRDLTLLPNNKFPTILNGLDQITSREVYRILCERRPDLDGIQHLQEAFNDKSFWSRVGQSSPPRTDASFKLHKLIIPRLLINIPMRQYWTDELNGIEDLDQLKLFFVAGSCGHCELFQHLYTKIFDQTANTNTTTSIPTSDMWLSGLFGYILQLAAERGFTQVIQFLLTKFKIDDTNPTNIQVNSESIRHPTDPTPLKSYTTEAVYDAIYAGRLDVLKLLLTLPHNYPTPNRQDYYLSGVVRHLHVLKFLFLEIPGIDVKAISLSSLRYASAMGIIDTVQFLLSTFPDISTYTPSTLTSSFANALTEASTMGHLNVVKMLLKYRGNTDVGQALGNAARRGHLQIVKTLAMVPGINAGARIDYAIRSAAQEKHYDIVKFLTAHFGVDVGVEYNYVLAIVAEHGDLDMVKFLVGLPGVDPTASRNDALRRAASQGHLEVVKFLLTLPGVDIRSNDDEVFTRASSQGHLEIIRIWLLHSGVSASRISERFLSQAISGGHLDIVKLLVEFLGVDVTANNNKALRDLVNMGGKAEIFNYLMGFPGVDLSSIDSDPITRAVLSGQADILKLLLTVEGIDAFADNSIALRIAAKTGQVEIVKLLLAVPGMDPTVKNNNAFTLAAERGHVEVVKLLLDKARESNEFVRMVSKAGAEEFVNMFETFDWDDDDNYDLMRLRARARREKALKMLRAKYGQS